MRHGHGERPAAAAELVDLAIGLGGDTPWRRIKSAENHFLGGDTAQGGNGARGRRRRWSPESCGHWRASQLSTVRLYHNGHAEAVELLRIALDDAAATFRSGDRCCCDCRSRRTTSGSSTTRAGMSGTPSSWPRSWACPVSPAPHCPGRCTELPVRTRRRRDGAAPGARTLRQHARSADHLPCADRARARAVVDRPTRAGTPRADRLADGLRRAWRRERHDGDRRVSRDQPRLAGQLADAAAEAGRSGRTRRTARRRRRSDHPDDRARGTGRVRRPGGRRARGRALGARRVEQPPVVSDRRLAGDDAVLPRGVAGQPPGGPAGAEHVISGHRSGAGDGAHAGVAPARRHRGDGRCRQTRRRRVPHRRTRAERHRARPRVDEGGRRSVPCDAAGRGRRRHRSRGEGPHRDGGARAAPDAFRAGPDPGGPGPVAAPTESEDHGGNQFDRGDADIRAARRAAVGAARQGRTGPHRRHPHRRPQPADAVRAAGRRDGGHRRHQQGHRGGDVHQHQDRRAQPDEDLPQAGHRLTRGTGPPDGPGPRRSR